MKIHILNPGEEAAVEDFLLQHLESSMILLSNLRRAGLSDHGQPFEGTYFAASIEDQLVGVAAQFWQGNVVLQTPGPEGLRCLGQLLAAVQGANLRPIGGFLGVGEQVDRALQLLAPADTAIQLDEKEGLFALALDDLVVPSQLVSGQVTGRRAETRDLDTLATFRLDYHLEALGSPHSSELEEACRNEMAASIERGETWILETDGEKVASSSFNAAIDEVVQIGGVWTPPRFRRRGYGRAAVAASLLDARREGVGRAVLFTGDDNVGAVKAYVALGFELIGDHRIVLLRSN